MINIEVHFVGYLYIMDLINAWEMEHIKVLVVFSCSIQAKEYSAYVYDEGSMIWWGGYITLVIILPFTHFRFSVRMEVDDYTLYPRRMGLLHFTAAKA
jgi:hypothetical protein